MPPAEETQRRLAEEEGAGAGKEWCLEAGFDPEKLKVGTGVVCGGRVNEGPCNWWVGWIRLEPLLCLRFLNARP